MARKVRNSALDSKAGREKLLPRGKPYYARLQQDLHLGFRKGHKAEKWVLRRYCGGQTYEVETFADAETPTIAADGAGILTFDQAAERARSIFAERTRPTAPSGPKVRDAVGQYIAMRDAREAEIRGSLGVRSDANQRLGRHVMGQERRGRRNEAVAAPLADAPLDAGLEAALRTWRLALPGDLRPSTKARLCNDLRAALNGFYSANKAFLDSRLPEYIRDGLSGSQDGKGPPVARDNQILSDADVAKLLRAAREMDVEQDWGGDLFRMVLVLAATGSRFSQVNRLTVASFQAGRQRLMMPSSRKGRDKDQKVETIPIGADVVAELLPITVGRAGNARLLERPLFEQVPGQLRWRPVGRGAWQKSALQRPWQAVRARAGLPEVIIYALRHSSIVRDIRHNVPIPLVAAKHDTSAAMIEKHYALWITSGLEEVLRAALVPLVPALLADNVVQIARAGA